MHRETLGNQHQAPRLTVSRHALRVAVNGKGVTEISIQPAIITGKRRLDQWFTAFPRGRSVSTPVRAALRAAGRRAVRMRDSCASNVGSPNDRHKKFGPNLALPPQVFLAYAEILHKAAGKERVLPPAPIVALMGLYSSIWRFSCSESTATLTRWSLNRTSTARKAPCPKRSPACRRASASTARRTMRPASRSPPGCKRRSTA